MTDTEVADVPALSESEAKYFESGGETEVTIESTDVENNDDGNADAETGGESGDGGSGGDADKNKTVPIHALHEERERRKATDKRARELEIENTKFRERFSILEKLNAPKEEAKGPPSPEEDIFGAFSHLSQTVQSLQQKLSEGEAARQHEGQIAQLVNHYQADAAQFTTKTPDYMDAYNFLIRSRAEELMALGYETQAELTDALRNEEITIATLAFQKNKSPASMIYDLAQKRGYKKADPKAAAEAKLDTIERGSGLHKSLSATSGTSGEGEMTAEQLLNMPNDEFEAWCNKNPAKARRLMGG